MVRKRSRPYTYIAVASYGALGHVPPSAPNNNFSQLSKSTAARPIWFPIPCRFENV